jgi:hypothetical protein
MSRSLYAPFLVAITVNTFCLLLINFIPSSILFTRSGFALVEDHDSTSFQDLDDLSPTTAHAETALIAQSPVPNPTNETTVKHAWNCALESISSASALFEHPASRFCAIAYFLKRIAFASEGFMFQYASEKFLWPLHQTTWLRVAQACGAVTATLIICPLLTQYLSRRGVASRVTDLSLIRSSLLILMISFFFAWKSPSAILFAVCMMSFCLISGGSR